MNFFKTLILSAAAILTLVSATDASAQYKLPELHSTQHRDLLARQRPVGEKFIKKNNDALFESVREREEAAEKADDLYTTYWDSQSVNPYGGATIPAMANLDVSGYIHPVPGHVTSAFGYRPRFGRVHKGVDLKLNVGDTVKCAFDGVVRLTRYEARGYGYYVVVRHDNGMETVYGHLSRFLVKPNQRVRAGEGIALGGNTGRSTGPHLHFETRYMGLTINPADIIDFDRQCPHADVYAFNKAAYDKVMNSFPKGRRYATSKSAKRKSSARKRTSTKRRR